MALLGACSLSLVPGYLDDGALVFALGTVLVWVSLILQAVARWLGRERIHAALLLPVFVGLVLVAFDLDVKDVPFSRDAHLPYPDVRLSATAQRATLEGEQTASGHDFVVVDVDVYSVYGNRGEDLNPYNFELSAGEQSCECSSANFDLDGACGETLVAAGG